jgi:hypothetical protein
MEDDDGELHNEEEQQQGVKRARAEVEEEEEEELVKQDLAKAFSSDEGEAYDTATPLDDKRAKITPAEEVCLCLSPILFIFIFILWTNKHHFLPKDFIAQ